MHFLGGRTRESSPSTSAPVEKRPVAILLEQFFASRGCGRCMPLRSRRCSATWPREPTRANIDTESISISFTDRRVHSGGFRIYRTPSRRQTKPTLIWRGSYGTYPPKRRRDVPCGRSVGRNIHLSEATWHRCGNGRDDVDNVHPQDRPLRIPEHDDSDRAARQILLVADVLVRGDLHVKAGGFCSDKQFAILNVSQPCAFACRTVWPVMKDCRGAGVPWSNRMSISALAQALQDCVRRTR